MARIRSIKPEFWTDGNVARMTPLARLFFIGMWNFSMCDYGHVVDDAIALKVQILPFDDVEVEDLLKELIELGRVTRMTLPDGRSFLHVTRFTDHQKLDKRWSPRCFACRKPPQTSTNHTEAPANSAEVRGGSGRLTETPRTSPQDRTGQDRRKNSSSTAPRSTDRHDPDFAKFWSVYPRKVGKGEARKAWAKLVKAGVDPADIIAGAERYRDDPNRKRQEIKFTKHPGPWLNAERWTDQLDHADAKQELQGWWSN